MNKLTKKILNNINALIICAIVFFIPFIVAQWFPMLTFFITMLRGH